jgi:gas vesicle protein
MRTNDDGKIFFLLIGLGLGAIGGLIAALLAREENREALREGGAKSLEYLNEQAEKLRETTEAIVEKGKDLMSHG